ncbi:cytochrome P450 [Abortiporus biennis]|nr:cytochrome P450 [Abortiporus biennis]
MGLTTQSFFLLTFVFFLVNVLRPQRKELRSIPTVKATLPWLPSIFGALLYAFRAEEITQRGYEQYRGCIFKIPQITRWQVVVTGRKFIEELRKADDEDLSFVEAVNENFQLDYTIGPEINAKPFHIAVVRGHLTRNIGTIIPKVLDEIQLAFQDIIPPHRGWTSVSAHDAVLEIVCRTVNRIFVGEPLCCLFLVLLTRYVFFCIIGRNHDFGALNIGFTMDVAIGGTILGLFPSFLRPFLVPWLTNVPKSIERGIKHLKPIIEERYRMMEGHKDPEWEDRPNDLLMWLMDEVDEENRTVPALVRRILTLNFAAVHTTTMSFMYALYRLAAQPTYVDVLREEIEPIVESRGWDKDAIESMTKLDSFLRECQRFYGLGNLTMFRKAMKDFAFSDGTVVPSGTFVAAPELPLHHDEEFYGCPNIFNPWRFSDKTLLPPTTLTASEGKFQFVTTSPEYLAFGHGKNACPGRFFAAVVLKCMISHMILHYDLRMEHEGVVPEPVWYGDRMMPNPKANVMFRRRET